ncbi:VWA domain-containing protein [candidate division KSB1 bacterium]|nr:VWA domain-containing protein [candidate division KSB1 bacterium]
MKRFFLLIITVFIYIIPVLADGLLIPTDENYPKDFIQNRLTRVTVEIYGTLSITTVYQEFVNEGIESTDAVYSFPLPPDARATEFLYWRGSTIYKAVLKVREQATNPGTGEGGIIALVNKYIGRNGIKIALKKIPPAAIQKVQLKYISHCDYYNGKTTYRFPLDTGDFIKYPLDHLQFTFIIKSQAEITGYACPTHGGIHEVGTDKHNLNLELIKPKEYTDRDLEFWYTCNQNETGVDFYSVANDSMDGHFVLYIKPVSEISEDNILPKRIVFLVNNSSQMFGYKLDQTIKAIKKTLDLLKAPDYFNIIVYNNSYSQWKSEPVDASSENINDAKSYLVTVTTGYGSYLDQGLKVALTQFQDNNYSNSILVFTDGRSPIDPREIESINMNKVGIFPIGIGDNIDRARLEMTAGLNYGFVTYFNENDNLYEGMVRVFDKISKPILKDVTFEYGQADLYDILPEKIPTTFAGSYFFTTGRYKTAGQSAFSMAGNSTSGQKAFDFFLDFSANKDSLKFAESIWAKEKIDALEREIEIYGETEELKSQLIDISLKYNIRCRYTAYIADYQNEFTAIEKFGSQNFQIPNSHIIGNYPNPFNPVTTIKFLLSPESVNVKTKFIKIFNSLGQLVAVIDISNMQPGLHEIRFKGRDFFGNPLPTGLYLVSLQIGEQISTIRITLVK